MYGISRATGILHIADVLFAVNAAYGGRFHTPSFFFVFLHLSCIVSHMKKVVLIVAVIIVVGGAVVWFSTKNRSPNDENANTQQNNAQITIISSEKPVSLVNVEMTTYKSPNGYEITYPKQWHSILAPQGTNPYVEDYSIYPKEIEYGPAPLIKIMVSNKSLQETFVELNLTPESLQKISINGKEGYKNPETTNKPNIDYFFESDGRVYRMTYWYAPEYGVSQEEALWVLSTFKVTG